MPLTDIEKMDEFKSSLIKKIESINSLADIKKLIINATKTNLKQVVTNKVNEFKVQLQTEMDAVTTKNEALIAKLDEFLIEVGGL